MSLSIVYTCAALVLVAAPAIGNEPQESAPPQDAPPRRAPLGEVAAFEPRVDTAAGAAATSPPSAPPAGGFVMDTLDLGTTSITGTQELPRVLYIVPWKRSDLGELVGRPVNTLLDEVLAPVDPAVFERHLRYYDALHGLSE